MKTYIIQICDNNNVDDDFYECQYKDISDGEEYLAIEPIDYDGDELMYCEECASHIIDDYLSDQETYPRSTKEDGGCEISWDNNIIYLSIDVSEKLYIELKADGYRD